MLKKDASHESQDHTKNTLIYEIQEDYTIPFCDIFCILLPTDCASLVLSVPPVIKMIKSYTV